MKLIYVWVEKFRSIEKQAFSFDREFTVTFNNEEDSIGEKPKLEIKKSERKPVFFGNKIINITAMIGENGSGKTNLLDLLGYQMSDRFQFANQNAEYFIIYHLEGNQFIIEGSNIEKLGILGEHKAGISKLYSIIAELDNEHTLKFVRFLQDEGENKLTTFINIRHKFNDTNWSRTSFTLEEDPYYFFQRFAIDQNNTGIFSKFQFLRDASVHMEENSSNSFFELSPETIIKIKPHINIRDKPKLLLKYKREDYFRLSSLFQPNQIEPKEKKRHFIHSFLEVSVQSLYQECIEFHNEDADKILSQINNISFQRIRPKEYLLGVLEVLGDYWDKFIGGQNKLFVYYKQLYDLLSKVSEGCFEKESIVVKVHDTYDNNTLAFLQHLDEPNNPVVSLFFSDIQPLSSGEEAYLNLFTSLYYTITVANNAENKTCILLLDEPDSFMHPEWSRIMINQIIDYLEGTKVGYSNYQIILTTHSPLIISDLPKQNLIALRKQTGTGKSIRTELDHFPETFASNIHTLLSNEFFMENTIGEFAKQKITWVIDRLREIIDGGDYLEVEKEQIEQWIETIGEPLIKGQVLQLYAIAFKKNSRHIWD